MSSCIVLTPTLPSTFSAMSLTHLNSALYDPINPRSPKRKASSFDLPDPRRSPPALREPCDSTTARTRLHPNPYSADEMATIPPPQRISPSSSASPGRGDSLPSIRDVIPELPTLTGQSGPGQGYGPESFQPSGPTIAAGTLLSGLNPSPLTSIRSQSYSTSDQTSASVFSERSYPGPAPSGSRGSTSRSSPIQPLQGQLPGRGEPIRALPPLGTTYGSGESSRSSPYSSYSAPMQQAPQYPGQPHPAQGYRPGPSQPPYGAPHPMQNTSPPYAHYDNAEYNSDGKSKRRRGNLPKQVTDTLRKWFNEHIAHPYPTEEEKMMLMQQTGLTMSQISNWFINARRRSMPASHGQDSRQGEANFSMDRV